jgi:uncharacterized coiled-coil DUF342 family protein
MKHLAWLLWLGLWPNHLHAQTPPSRLQQLQDQRAELYNDWKDASNQKSGFFGNKTKDDLQKEIQALEEIVAQDTQILDALDQLRQDEKKQISQEYNDLVDEYNRLLASHKETEGSLIQHKSWQKENRQTIASSETFQLVLMASTLGLGLLSLVLFFKNKALRRQQ